jgi:hypothetical protein
MALTIERLESRTLFAADDPIESGDIDLPDDSPEFPDDPAEICHKASFEADAQFHWEVAERFGRDADHDGRIDVPNTHEYANPKEFTVRMRGNFCGDHQWSINGLPAEPLADSPHILYTNLAPGMHSITHTNTNKEGQQDTVTQQIEVAPDLLFVSIGDSAASGEGNPEVRQKFDEAGFVESGPKWQDSPHSRVCDRSTLAGPAQAALQLEDSDPHRSVTFVHVACSGADIHAGLLGPQQPEHPGYVQEPAWANDTVAPQLDQVRQITCTDPDQPGVETCREIDVLTISVGVNDAGFADVVSKLVQKPYLDTLVDLTAQVHSELASLELRYGELAEALGATGSPLVKVRPENVYITQYPDILHDENGSICDDILDDIVPFAKIDHREAYWAHEKFLRPLNNTVAQAANKFGWTLVEGIPEAFHKHGYCASGDARWVRTADQSRRFQGPYHNPAVGGLIGGGVGGVMGAVAGYEAVKRSDRMNTKGTLHPNEKGHEVIADLIFETIQRSLAPGNGRFEWINALLDLGPLVLNQNAVNSRRVGSNELNGRALAPTTAWVGDSPEVREHPARLTATGMLFESFDTLDTENRLDVSESSREGDRIAEPIIRRGIEPVTAPILRTSKPAVAASRPR